MQKSEALQQYAVRNSVGAFIQNVIKDREGIFLKQGHIHNRIQSFLNSNEHGVIEIPRGHGKTTQIEARIAWRIGQDPNLLIKIVSSTADNAVARGRAIKEIIESPLYHYYFPHIIPGREWNDTKFSVKRNLIGSTDATVECYGIDGAKSGPRADELYLDDPDDVNVVTSQAERKSNWEYVSNGWLLQKNTENSKQFIVCTPWHESDIAGQLKANGWPCLSIPIVDMTPVWPEHWSAEALRDIRKNIGSMAFCRGYELKPMSTENSIIKPEWFKYWTERPAIQTLCVITDPAISENSGADYTSIGLMGADANGNFYLLALRRERMDFPNTLKANVIMATYGQAQYGIQPIIGIESVAYQKALPQQLRYISNFAVSEIKAVSNKYMRAAKLAVHIENGKVYLKGASPTSVHPEQAIVFDEAIRFPSAEHDDTLDMLGYGVEMLSGMGGQAKFSAGGARQSNARAALDGF